MFYSIKFIVNVYEVVMFNISVIYNEFHPSSFLYVIEMLAVSSFIVYA